MGNLFCRKLLSSLHPLYLNLRYIKIIIADKSLKNVNFKLESLKVGKRLHMQVGYFSAS